MQQIDYAGTLETKFYTGRRDRDIHEAMDEDLRSAEAKGGTLVKRARIGRNATCPCGSKRKFKKCCMAGARALNTR